jgi:hypothetical protein
VARRGVVMGKMKFGILLVVVMLALVSVVSAALPSQVTATITHPGSQSYWDVDVTVGGGDIPAANDYIGWCSDTGSGITAGSHVFNVYSSLGSIPSGLPPMDWAAANWIINNKGNADKCTVQTAIWHFDGAPHTWCPVDPDEYERLVTGGTAASAAHYMPGVGENYAAILWDARVGGQPVFIGIPVPEIPSPEFPTLALPVALMIGIVGAVQYIKTRKE